MNFRKRIDEAHRTADALLTRLQDDAKARCPDDDFSRLNFEIGMLHATIRNLMIDLELSKDEVRRLLQVMGTEVGRKLIHEDVWVWRLFNEIAEGERIVIPDVRFPNEARMIESQGGEVWRINRHNHAAVNDHISEHALDNHMFKRAIYNDGTLDDLSDEIFMLMHNVFKL